MDADSAFRLTNQVALITGSTRGIGAAIAEEFARAGAAVIVTGRDLAAASKVAHSIATTGGEAHGLAYDAAKPNAGADLIEAVRKRFGRLDLLVNNAAILRPHSVERLSETEFDEIFAVNTKAALFLCKAALELLERGSSPAVVNITAAGAHRPMAGIGAYCASKAAMVSFTATLAQEWAARGIRVNALTPGSIATDMILPANPTKRAAFERDMADQNLMKRLGHPLEIARAARFLASPASSFMTGQTLIVDGGFLTR